MDPFKQLYNSDETVKTKKWAQFPGWRVLWEPDYKPCLQESKPDQVGSNDIASENNVDRIAKSVADLAKNAVKHYCSVIISSIITTIADIKLWNTWRFSYRFHSPGVKCYLISSTKNIVAERNRTCVISLVPSLPSTGKRLATLVKYYAKTCFKVYSSCPILHDFLTLFPKFCPRL